MSFNLPTSLAFGQGSRNQKSVFVVISGLFGQAFGPSTRAPGVVQVGVGVPGFKSH